MPAHRSPKMAMSAMIFYLCVLINKIHANEHKKTLFVNENMPKSTVVGSVALSADDRRLRNVSHIQYLSYSIVSQSPIGDGHLFAIDDVTSILTTRRVLDRESTCAGQGSCLVTLGIRVANSKRGLFFHVTFPVYVHIRDVNDNAPRFDDDITIITVDEDMRVNSTVGIAAATDADSGVNAMLTYTGNWNRSLFSLDVTRDVIGQEQLALTLLKSLDADVVSTYEFHVIVTDNGVPKLSTSLLVRVLVRDVNDNSPKFDFDTYSVHVSESSDIGTLVTRLEATDGDSGINGDVTYKIAEHNSNIIKAAFAINETSGQLHLRRKLDYEQAPRLSVFVVAMDNGLPRRSSECEVMIFVQDENDNPTMITVSFVPGGDHARVMENARVGILVAYLTLSDADSISSTVACHVSPDKILQIVQNDANTYHVVLAASVRGNAGTDYVIRVTCADIDDATDVVRRDFTMKIVDINDHAPVFVVSEVFVTLYEQWADDMIVARVAATDMDLGLNGQIRYKIPNDTISTAIHNEDSVTFSPIRSNYTDVTNLTNLNPFSAHCTNNETESICSIRFGLLPEFLIVMDSTSGEIRISGLLDREILSEIRFLVIASDSSPPFHTATATVVIATLDVNDNPPLISVEAYSYGVAENQPPHTFITRVTATDRDLGDNSALSYGILAGDKYFSIDRVSGMLRSRVVFDRERRDKYNVEVIVSDNGTTPLNATVVLSVAILDTNDNSPVFTYPIPGNDTIVISDDYFVKRNTVSLTRVSAFDIDDGDNADISYTIKTLDQEISIDSGTGILSLSRNVKRQRNISRQYNITVIATDNGDIRRETIAHLYVRVIPLNMTSTDFIELNVIIAATLIGATIVLCVVLIALIVFIRRQRAGVSAPQSQPDKIVHTMDSSYVAYSAPTDVHLYEEFKMASLKVDSGFVDTTDRDSTIVTGFPEVDRRHDHENFVKIVDVTQPTIVMPRYLDTNDNWTSNRPEDHKRQELHENNTKMQSKSPKDIAQYEILGDTLSRMSVVTNAYSNSDSGRGGSDRYVVPGDTNPTEREIPSHDVFPDYV